jgi:hypothetical protein
MQMQAGKGHSAYGQCYQNETKRCRCMAVMAGLLRGDRVTFRDPLPTRRVRQTTAPTVGIAHREDLLHWECETRFYVLLLAHLDCQRVGLIESLPLRDGSHRLLLERIYRLQLVIDPVIPRQHLFREV